MSALPVGFVPFPGLKGETWDTPFCVESALELSARGFTPPHSHWPEKPGFEQR